jgi:V/A-type H+-transporting ATPase subunit F
MSLVVVGSKDFVFGFRLAGVRRTYAVAQKDLEQKINELLDDKTVSILVLWEEETKNLSKILRKKLVESVKPVVVSVGKTEEEDIREKIKRAIGLDLYKR